MVYDGDAYSVPSITYLSVSLPYLYYIYYIESTPVRDINALGRQSMVSCHKQFAIQVESSSCLLLSSHHLT